jgi:hypothetical protein
MLGRRGLVDRRLLWLVLTLRLGVLRPGRILLCSRLFRGRLGFVGRGRLGDYLVLGGLFVGGLLVRRRLRRHLGAVTLGGLAVLGLALLGLAVGAFFA